MKVELDEIDETQLLYGVRARVTMSCSWFLAGEARSSEKPLSFP